MVHTLKALFDTGQVSKAAERLGVSQPSVSQNLKRLRDYFGDPLFVRSGNRLYPTPRAMALEPTVARLARDIGLISQQPEAFDPATANRSFIVSFTDIAEFMVLPRLGSDLLREAPGCNLLSVRPTIQRMQEALEQGEVDVAAGTLHGTDVTLRQQRLGEYTFVCLVSLRGRWARKPLTLTDYRDAPHVMVPRTSDAVDPIAQRLELQGVHRRIAVTVANHFAACSAVEQTDLLFTVPQHVAGHLAKLFHLRVVPLPIDLGTVVTRIVWHERFHHDPGNLWLRKRVERIYRAVVPQQKTLLAQ
ncbi:Nodulation protein D 2 [Variovorax sp. PBS-H4]|nr:Nodulation protein D 2 [Variovorax sp. PBS-H4]